MATILTVDDEPGIRAFLVDTLSEVGDEILEAADGEDALRTLEDRPIDLMLLDLRMPGAVDGMGVLRQARALWPEMQVVVLTAYGTVGNAVEAMRLGAFDFLEKPLESPAVVRSMVRRALNWRGHVAPTRRIEAATAVGDAAAPASLLSRRSRLRSLLHEMRRRHVYQAAATYLAVAFAALQGGQLVLPVLPLPAWTYSVLVGLAIAGVPVVLTLGWIYDVSLTRTGRFAVHHER